MRRLSVFSIPSLLAGILFFLGFTPPATAGTFEVHLTKAEQRKAVDVCSGMGKWTFDVTIRGKVSSFQRTIKNDLSAGDICWGSGLRFPKENFKDDTGDTTLIPQAAPDVCPGGFSDENGTPLTFSAFSQIGDKSGGVDIIVTYPDYVGTPPLDCP